MKYLHSNMEEFALTQKMVTSNALVVMVIQEKCVTEKVQFISYYKPNFTFLEHPLIWYDLQDV